MELENRKRNQRIINRQLHNAVEENNMQKVEDSLKKGAEVNAKENGSTALHYAIGYNNIEIVKVLLKSGANINLLDNDGRTALLSSADPEIVKLLANAQSLQIPNRGHKTQLELADPSSNEENLKILNVEYSPDKHDLWNVVESNQNVRVLEIDSRRVYPDFLNHCTFYTTIKNAENLFLVDVDTGGGKLVLNEEAIKDQLSDIKKPLIIQCKSLLCTIVYTYECREKEPEILNLNVPPSEKFDEETLIKKLSGKDSLGLKLLIEALKSGLVGTFNNDPSTCRDLRSITFDVNKHFYSWRIIDYAVRYDHFLLTRFLSLYDWDLTKQNEATARTMEIAAKYASVDTLTTLIDIQLPLPTQKISILENKSCLFNPVNNEEDTPLLIAAKNGKEDNVDFFIRCGAVVNHRNKLGKIAADLAWANCHYDTLLTLLEADSDFPKGLKFEEDNKTIKKLKIFCEDRKKLHASIQEGDLPRVKEFISNNRSPLKYLNSQNESALFTAITAEKFEIYAFLLSVNAKFKDEQELEYVFILSEDDKETLKRETLLYFYPIENAHILYLVSQSKRLGTVGNFKEKIESLYQELNAVPEMSTILKVIQYCDYVDIIFDFNTASTLVVDPTSSKYTRGKCDYKSGRLYIGAKVDRAELLGTLAHELTHLAMQIKYNNDCNPYEKSECEKESQFEAITKSVKQSCEATPTKIDVIISRVFTVYRNPNVWPAELVVRVPHLYAKYGREKGRHLLGNQAPELLDYYEKTVLPDCEVFIRDHFLIKRRNNVRLLNQISGIAQKITESEIQFKRSFNFDNFFNNQDKNVLLLNTKSVLLSNIKIYQYLRKMPFYSASDSCLFLDFKLYNEKQLEVHHILCSEVSKLLVVQYPTNSDKKQLANVLNRYKFLSKKSNKKIIFIVQENEVAYFKKALNVANLSDSYVEQNEQQLTLNNLTSDSQNILLKKEILFQGKKEVLRYIIDDNSKEFIGSEILDKFINNEEIKIGSELTISSCYDRDYYIDRTFNCQIQINSKVFKAKDNYDLLAVSGANKSDISKLMVQGERIRLFEENDPNKNNPIRFIVLDDQNPGKQFKKLCQQYPTRYIHWLISDAAKFIWKKSQGTVSHLLKYREQNKDYDCDGNDANLKEEDLVTSNTKQKIVIISDKAGMGKSTVLTNLSMDMKNKFNNEWVVRVDLNDCSKALELELQERKYSNFSFINHETNSNRAVDFLLNEVLESDEKLRLRTSSEKELFKHRFNVQGDITVMFDGFDEICPRYKNIVLDLLQALRSTSVYKLLVTTRPNVIQELEENLEVFSCTLEPFSEENQVEFLTKFWKKKLGLQYINQENKECLVKYAEALIDKFCTSISDREKVFTGIPLQMKMVAEIFQENREETQNEWQGCKEFLETHNENREPKLPDTLDLFCLYEHFVKKKLYDICLQEKQIINFTNSQVDETAEILYNDFKQKHELLALHRLLNDTYLKELLSEVEIQTIDSSIKNMKNWGKENRGIIDQIIDDKAHFIHLTFAEYFASFPLVDRMFFGTSNITTTVLKCIDSVIAKTSPVFINSLIRLLDAKQTEVDGLLKGRTLLNLVTQEGNLHFVTALSEGGYDNYPEPDHMDKTPLHYAAEYGHSNIVEFLLNYNNDILEDDILEHGIFKKEEYSQSKLVEFVNKQDRAGNTAVYYAAEKGNMDIAADLLLKGADTLTLKEYLIPVTLFVTKETLSAYANDYHKLRPIVEELLIRAPESVTHYSEHYEYPRLLSYFFVHGRVHVVDVLLSSIHDEEKRKRILNADDNSFTPLDRVNNSDKLRDDDRLEMTKYLFENCGLSFESSKEYIRNILQAAAQRGHIKTFKFFLSKENFCDYYRHLNRASEYHQLNIIQFLLENHRENMEHQGKTALHASVESGASLKIIKYVIDNGEDINAETDLGETPLYLAIYHKRGLNVIKYLTDHGANVNKKAKIGYTPLHYAIEEERWDIITHLFFNCKAEVGSFPKLVRNKFDFFIDPDKFNLDFVDHTRMSRLHLAMKMKPSNDIEWGRFIIRYGGDVNIVDPEGRTPLHLASERQQTEIVELLLQYGAVYDHTDFSNRTPLDFASRVGLNLDKNKICWLLTVLSKLFNSKDLMQDLNQQLLREHPNGLLEWGPYGSQGLIYDAYNPMLFIFNARNVKRETLLHIAANINDTKAMDSVLQIKQYLPEKPEYLHFYNNFQFISVDAMDHEKNTPLHLAAQKGYNESVSYLLKRGATFNFKNKRGETPETLAESNSHDHVVELLHTTKNLFGAIKQHNLREVKNYINQGAYVDVKDESCNSPLHFAAASGECNILQFLLKRGANIEAIDIRQRTPLHFAAENNKIEAVKLLLRHGASFYVRDKQDKAPFELEDNRSVRLLFGINKLFTDIQSATPEVVIDHIEREILGKDYDMDINTIMNIRDRRGNTVLHYAVYYYDITFFLLQNGAIFNAKNKSGSTAEEVATQQDIKDLLQSIDKMFLDVTYIFQYKESVDVQIITNVRNAQGMTLLHKAAISGKLEVVKWLVERGADVSARDKGNRRALEWSAIKNKIEVMKYLRGKETDVNAADNEGN